jgi:hypothetical protein
MKIILVIFFFLLLLMSCTNEKPKVYPRMNIYIDTTDNIERKNIHLHYKDSSTMTTSSINILTKEMYDYYYSRKMLDSSGSYNGQNSYSKTKMWTAEIPKGNDDDYYYSEDLVINNYTKDSRIETETKNRVSLYSKKKISYQKRLELIAWPMSQLMFIGGKRDSIITGSYRGDSISYQYKITKYPDSWRTARKGDATIILKNTNDTIYVTLGMKIK